MHNLTPTADLTDYQYDLLLVHLGEKLTAACLAQGYPEDETDKWACDALVNTFGTTPDQTIRSWLTAAGARLGVDTADCVGA